MRCNTPGRPMARHGLGLARARFKHGMSPSTAHSTFFSFSKNKAKVNKGNRNKKTLLHHSDSRPFSYRMDARRRGGSKFPEIDVFGDVYVRPGNELAESLHTMMVERSQLVLQEFASQLPPNTSIESVDPSQDAGFQILTETLDQTLGRRLGTYCRGMGNARRREPRPLSLL
ncbi:unnamed protein product [Prunus armeniaca]